MKARKFFRKLLNIKNSNKYVPDEVTEEDIKKRFAKKALPGEQLFEQQQEENKAPWLADYEKRKTDKQDSILEQRKIYKKSDCLELNAQERAFFLKRIGCGFSLDENNAKFIRVTLDGHTEPTIFLVKESDGIDSVIASDFLRTVSAKHFFAKQEILIQDGENLYMAVKFAKDIVKNESVAVNEKADPIEQEVNYLFFGDPTLDRFAYLESFHKMRESYKKDQKFMEDTAYMLGCLQVFGAHDDNPQNFVTKDKGSEIPGKIDSQFSNMHPDHFLSVLKGQDDEFRKKARDYILDPENNPEPIKNFATTALDYFCQDELAKNERFGVFGCFQSAGFFLNNIVGEELLTNDNLHSRVADKVRGIKNHADNSDLTRGVNLTDIFNTSDNPPYLEVKTEYKNKLMSKDDLQKVAKCYKEALLETAFNIEPDATRAEDELAIIIEKKSQEILNKIIAKIQQEKRQGSDKTKRLFVSFMHGINAAIELANNKEYLENYAKKYPENEKEIAQQAIKILQENAREADQYYAPLLNYYKEIRNETPLKKREVRKKESKKLKPIDPQNIKDFEMGEPVRITQKYLYKADRVHVASNVGGDIWQNEYSAMKYRSPIDEIEITKSPSETVNFDDEKIGFKHCNKRLRFSSIGGVFLDTDTPNPRRPEIQYNHLHVNLVNDSTNFGGKVLEKEGGNNEENSRRSTTNLTMAYLHQNRKTSKFYDLSLGNNDPQNPYYENGKILSSRPILIRGVNFSDAEDKNHYKKDQLNIALPNKNQLKRNESDVATHIFQSFCDGIKLYKSRLQTQAPIELISTADPNSQISPFLQIAMQILAANACEINLKICDKFFEKDNCKKEIAYFRLRVLPLVNNVLKEESTLKNKISQINKICQKFEVIYKRRIESKILNSEYEKLLKTSRANQKKPNKDAFGAKRNDYKAKLRELITESENLKTKEEIEKFTTDFTSLKRPKSKGNIMLGEEHTTIKKIPLFGKVVKGAQSRKLEKKLTSILKEKGLLPDDDSITRLDEAQKYYSSQRKSPTYNISRIPGNEGSEQINLTLSENNNDQNSDSGYDDEGPEPCVESPKSVQVIARNTQGAQLKDQINQVIKITTEKLNIPQIDKKIEILMDAMSQYGNEYLHNIDGKNIDSVISGSADAGFTKWRKEEEFLVMLRRKCQDNGVENIDLKDSMSDGVKEFAKISRSLQDNSKDIFQATKGKNYQGAKNMSRSWRMAMAKDLVKNSETQQESGNSKQL